MKNIKALFKFILLSMLLIACENDGGDSKLAFDTGAVPNIQKTQTSDSFINLVELNNDQTIKLELNIDIALGAIEAMDIVGFYTDATTTYKAILKTDQTTFPFTLSLTAEDLINAFPNLSSRDDFKIGDKLIISANVKLKDGRIYKIYDDNGEPNFSQDVANANQYSVGQTYLVSCPSDLAGIYDVVSTGETTDPFVAPSKVSATNFPYTVTITDTGGGNYTMSDAFGGLYLYWYDIYGITTPYEGKFTDVCGTLSGKFEEPFGTQVTLTGTVNSDGTLSIHWINEYDDYANAVYTKRP
ncbi:hypothetical protein [Flavobacterium sp. UMI-01]|uniref:hypothetical protein n=1 Tax=Flavobacterium sp. UMI-01 TaxID=1441053 RepID=UPI001C7CEDB3|nr:hypothetical protein [Flavobacterium sp. UMI-01]GIZ07374.1 hypothetical protein FUMI01_01010 [Flavobacterium sp. UMI-01]